MPQEHPASPPPQRLDGTDPSADSPDDVSARTAFVQTGRMATLGELTADLVHEINNPLFAILGLVEFLLEEVEPGSKARRRLEVIQESGLELRERVRTVLDFSRADPSARTVDSLGTVVREAVALARHTSAAREVVVVERYDGEPAVDCAPAQIKLLLLNLLLNARQAMPDGGTITVHVASDDGFAVASVTDTGPGVPPELTARVFEPFFTTRSGRGTGLGLALGRSIAEAHGGTLELEPLRVGGARFVLRLPRVTEAP